MQENLPGLSALLSNPGGSTRRSVMRIHNMVIGSLTLSAVVAATTPLAAEEICDASSATPNVTSAMTAELKASASVLATSDDVLGAPVGNARLATQRGGQDMIVNDQKLKATVTDNVASNLTTGNNVITEGAFAGSNGLPMVIQNSGNNVSIQSTTILNLNLK
jgi:hypothetical protein